MYYASFDSNGNITGFYNDEIHKSIPILAKPLTEGEWKDCVENQGLRKINVINKETIKLSMPIAQPITNHKKTLIDNLQSANTIAQIKAVLIEYFKS